MKFKLSRRGAIILGTIALAIGAYWVGRTVVDEMSARTLSIFLIAVGFWATEALPLFATSFVVIGLEILLLASDGGLADLLTQLLLWLNLPVRLQPDALPISASSFLNLFSQDIIILFMGGFLLSAAITKHGLDRAIAGTLLRPFTGSPLRLLYGVLGITAFFSMWMSNTATAAMMIAVITPLVRLVPAEDRFGAALTLAVAFGSNIGGIGTPIGTPANAIAFGALNAAGYHISFVRWVLVVLPLAVFILAIVGLLLYAFFKPAPGLPLHTLEPGGVITANGKTTLVILVVTVLLWLTSEVHGLTPGATALLAAAALAALGVLDHRDVGAIDWNILILMWGGLSLGVAMDQSGLTGYVQRADLSSLPGGGWAVAIVLVSFAVGLGTFMSNTATAALLVPASLALAVPGREQFTILAALACSFGMALPVSTPPNAMAYATGVVSVRQMLRTGGLISAIATILLLLGYQLMLPLIF